MSMFKLILGIVSNVAIFGMSLFLPAGTLDWWRAWVFLGVALVAAVASMAVLYRSDMALLEESFKPPVQKGQPFADKLLVLFHQLPHFRILQQSMRLLSNLIRI